MSGGKQAWLKIFDPVRTGDTPRLGQGFQVCRNEARGETRAPVRSRDPVTSRAGAAHVMGEINQRQQYALAAVCQHPNNTAAEIEFTLGCRDGRVRKRLKELVRAGLVEELAARPCEVTGHNATVYRATKQGETRGFPGTEPPAGVGVAEGKSDPGPAGAMDQPGGGDPGGGTADH